MVCFDFASPLSKATGKAPWARFHVTTSAQGGRHLPHAVAKHLASGSFSIRIVAILLTDASLIIAQDLLEWYPSYFNNTKTSSSLFFVLILDTKKNTIITRIAADSGTLGSSKVTPNFFVLRATWVTSLFMTVDFGYLF